MPYTLWSRGRLLGESDLGFPRTFAHVRMGWFYPSAEGEMLMTVLTGPAPALKAVGRLLRNPIRRVTRSEGAATVAGWPADIRATTEYADLVSSVDELEAMDLQVRDPDGVVMEIEHVGIDDIEFKRTFLSKKHQRHWDQRFEREPWQPAPERQRRYQLQVHFPGEMTGEMAAVP